MGKKQKTERKKERLNDGNNNGQATHGARKHAWRTQAARKPHASRLGQNITGGLGQTKLRKIFINIMCAKKCYSAVNSPSVF